MSAHEDLLGRIGQLDLVDDLYGERAIAIADDVGAALKQAANPYPRGWFKADGPLVPGYYWHRGGYVFDTKGVQPVWVHDGIAEMEFVYADGEWCGPIPEPPA